MKAGKGGAGNQARADNRFALAFQARPMLETARIGGDASVPYRGVAQLVEYRSPKPVVAGSSPAAPASNLSH